MIKKKKTVIEYPNLSKGYIGWVLFIYLLEGNRGFDIVFEMMLLIQLSQLSPKKRSEMK